jgi:hypothetical protein
MATGWDGDRILLLTTPDDPEPMLVWYTTWDTPEDADEFTRGAQAMLRMRLPGAEEKLNSDGSSLLLRNAGRVAWVSRVHRDVILVEGVPEARYREIAVALNRAVKEEVRVIREPWKLAK